MNFLRSTVDTLLDRSPEELIGALLVASAVALVMAGVYALGWRKTPPSPTVVGLLVLIAGILCMSLAAGYIEHLEVQRNTALAIPPGFPGWQSNRPDEKPPSGPWGFYAAGWSSGYHVVLAADEDRDGRITLEEAARLVRKADTDGDGSVDFRDIDRVIVKRLRSPIHPPVSSVPEGTKHDVGKSGEKYSHDEQTSPKPDQSVTP